MKNKNTNKTLRLDENPTLRISADKTISVDDSTNIVEAEKPGELKKRILFVRDQEIILKYQSTQKTNTLLTGRHIIYAF